MLYYFYVSNAGVPETGLVAGNDIAWESLCTAENGTSKTGPSLSEIGGGWYSFDITFGQSPWDILTEDLVGVIDCDTDGDAGLVDIDRYKPVTISLRGLALARIAHKGVQNKSTGNIDIYATDGCERTLTLEMTDEAASLTRNPVGPE